MSEQPSVGLPSPASGDPPTRDERLTVAPPADEGSSSSAAGMPELSIGPAGKPVAGHSPAEPPKLDGYMVDTAVGEGGMGTVWRGVQLSTRRNVALKLISAAGFGSERARQRFDREVEITARLEHPNIARVYDSGINRGVYFFAMELIDGVPLDQFVARQKLTRQEILRLFVIVCRAVHHAHTKGVIHRDLKPGNVLVSADGQPHVLDFGLAKALLQAGKEAGISLDGEVAGTPGYMAPEQAAGKSDLDPRCDVYSLGVILYRLLTGHTPHDLSGTYLDVLRRISEEEPTRPRLADKTMDRELEALLLHAIERNPKHRYADAGDLADDVENYLNGDPISARPPSVTYFLRKRAIKHRVKLVTLTVVLILCASAGLLTFGLMKSHRHGMKKEIEADQQTALALASERAKAIAYGDKALSDQKWDDARRFFSDGTDLFIRSGLSTLPADLGLWDVNRQSPAALMTIANPGNAAVSSSGLVFLPDGRRVLAGYGDGTLRLLDLATGHELRTIPAHASAIRSVAVGANGTLALSGGDDGVLRLWDLSNGELKREFPAPAGAANKLKRLALSPDGKYAMAARGESAETLESKPHDDLLTLFSVSNGKVLLNTEFAQGILDVTGSTTQICFSGDSRRVMAGGANVGVWNVADGTRIATIESSATAVAFSDDGRWIIAGSSNGDAKLLDLDAPIAPAKTFHGSGVSILAIAFDAHRDRVIEGMEDGGLRIINVDDIENWAHPPTPAGVNAIAFSPDFQAAVVAGDDGLAAFYIGAPPEEIELASGGPFADVSISGDGRLALVRSENRRGTLAGVRLFDTATGKNLTPKGFPSSRSSAAALSRDGKAIALVIDSELIVWSLDPAKETRRFSPRAADISDPTAIAITADGSAIALSGRGNALLVYRTGGTSEPLKLSGAGGRITSIAFSDDGRLVIAGSEDMTARAWNTQTGAPIATLRGHAAPINAVALSADGTIAVTASGSLNAQDNSVRMWELPGGRPMATLEGGGNTSPMRSVAISGNGMLIGAGNDASDSPEVIVWDRTTAKKLRSIRAKKGAARALALDESGQSLVYGADSAMVWNFGQAHTWRELKKATALAGTDTPAGHAMLARWYNYSAEPAWAMSLNVKSASLSPLDVARCEWMMRHLESAEEKLKSVSAQEGPGFYVKLCADAIHAERLAK